MTNQQTLELKSIVLNTYQYVLLLFMGGLSSGIFVWLFLWILDGDQWYLIGSTLWVNLFVLLMFGTLISHFYFRAEMKRFKEGHIMVNAQAITVKHDEQAIRIYKRYMFLRLRLEKQFYAFFGLRKITFVFAPIRGNKNQIESILVKREKAQEVYASIESCLKHS